MFDIHKTLINIGVLWPLITHSLLPLVVSFLLHPDTTDDVLMVMMMCGRDVPKQVATASTATPPPAKNKIYLQLHRLLKNFTS